MFTAATEYYFWDLKIPRLHLIVFAAPMWPRKSVNADWIEAYFALTGLFDWKRRNYVNVSTNSSWINNYLIQPGSWPQREKHLEIKQESNDEKQRLRQSKYINQLMWSLSFAWGTINRTKSSTLITSNTDKYKGAFHLNAEGETEAPFNNSAALRLDINLNIQRK